MTPLPQLRRIEIKGFKSIEAAQFEVKQLNVLIGANGAGKSNLIAFFRLLFQLFRGELQWWVSKSGGCASLLRFGPKQTSFIEGKLHVVIDNEDYAYEIRLEPGAGESLFLSREVFSGPKIAAIEGPHELSGLDEAGLRKLAEENEQIAAFVEQAEAWQTYHFNDTSSLSAVRRSCDIDDNRSLHPEAGNLAAFLYAMEQVSPKQFDLIRRTVRLVAPFFKDFRLAPDRIHPNRIQLEWTERGSNSYLNAGHLSDGTLRFICLSALLLQPKLPGLIVLDEPELGLHPSALAILASMIQIASTRSQVILATQSVTLLEQFATEDVVVVDRDAHGASTFERLDPQQYASWLEDYSLGELWEKNVLGGRPHP